MKKQVIICSSLIVSAIVATGTTLAYFTAEDTAENVISTGNIDIKINEYMKTEDTEELQEYKAPETPLMPGDTVSKIVKIQNTGDGSAYIRAKLNMYFDGAEELSTECVSLIVNDDKWTYNAEDGYYYYKDIVESGAETDEIFSDFTLDISAGNEYENQTLKIDIDAQAIQSKNNDGFHGELS